MFVFSAKRVRKKLGSKYETTTWNPKIFRLRYNFSRVHPKKFFSLVNFNFVESPTILSTFPP